MFGGLRSDARSQEFVHPVLRDETNAMAGTRTPEKCPEVSENCPSGTRKVHPKIGYLRVTDYTKNTSGTLRAGGQRRLRHRHVAGAGLHAAGAHPRRGQGTAGMPTGTYKYTIVYYDIVYYSMI